VTPVLDCLCDAWSEGEAVLLTKEAAWRIRRLSDAAAEQYFVITESIMESLPDKFLSCNCESAQTGSQ